MPRTRKRTQQAKTTKTPVSKASTKRITQRRSKKVAQPEESRWIWAQSYTSLLLGLVVVIIGILFIATFAKVRNSQQTSSTSTVATPTIEETETPTPTQKQQIYTVKEGDDLWHISEHFYNSGYHYVDIIKANKLENPSIINVGNQLIIPSVTPSPSLAQTSDENTELQIQNTPTPTPVIKADTYTVQKGDDLWNIAVRAYGDGYKWTDIAKANNLDNPGLIFSGNTIKIPR